jgi:hypothetical protein
MDNKDIGIIQSNLKRMQNRTASKIVKMIVELYQELDSFKN